MKTKAISHTHVSNRAEWISREIHDIELCFCNVLIQKENNNLGCDCEAAKKHRYPKTEQQELSLIKTAESQRTELYAVVQ